MLLPREKEKSRMRKHSGKIMRQIKRNQKHNIWWLTEKEKKHKRWPKGTKEVGRWTTRECCCVLRRRGKTYAGKGAFAAALLREMRVLMAFYTCFFFCSCLWVCVFSYYYYLTGLAEVCFFLFLSFCFLLTTSGQLW